MSKVSLKTQNIPLSISYCAVLYALFILTTRNTSNYVESFQEYFSSFSGNEIVVALFPLMLFVCSNLLPSNIKESIVLFRITNPLPGTRVFSKLIRHDPRINVDKLVLLIGELPKDPIRQNTTWYSLYKKVKDTIEVHAAHKSYLLAREICTLAFLYLLTVLILLILKINNTNVITLLIAIINYILFVIICNNTANRFALNVISTYVEKET